MPLSLSIGTHNLGVFGRTDSSKASVSLRRIFERPVTHLNSGEGNSHIIGVHEAGLTQVWAVPQGLYVDRAERGGLLRMGSSPHSNPIARPMGLNEARALAKSVRELDQRTGSSEPSLLTLQLEAYLTGDFIPKAAPELPRHVRVRSSRPELRAEVRATRLRDVTEGSAAFLATRGAQAGASVLSATESSSRSLFGVSFEESDRCRWGL